MALAIATAADDGMASMGEVYNYLSDDKTNGYTMSQFRTDWKDLTDRDKVNLREGIGNGSLTY